MRTVEVAGLPIGDGHPPRLMSALNMSFNSGFKPSVHTEAEDAARAVDEELVPAGADIIDVGLQSANPKYETEPPEYELKRLEQAAKVLDLVESDTIFSLETRYAEVAEAGIRAGFDIINDVGGFADPDMKPLVEDHDMPVIKMASPPDLTQVGALKTIDDVFEALQRDGFTDRTIIDPAFGGWYEEKTFEDNWEMFRRLREFRAFGRPILTATNREDFLGHLADQPETDNQLAVSLAAAVMEVERGAHVIRTHDTAETYDVVQVAYKLGDQRTTRSGAVSVSELTGTSLREAKRHVELDGEVSGSLSRTAPLSFSITDVPDADVDVIENAAALGDVAVVASGDQVFLVGSVAAFEDFLSDLPTNSPALETVADSIQKSVARELN